MKIIIINAMWCPGCLISKSIWNEIKEMYPRYLFVADLIFQKNVNGINNVNIVDFIYNNEDLK